MNILVTGATGAVGPRVVQVLSAAGYWVRTLSLDQPSKGQWSDDGETRIGDVTDKSAVQSAMQGVWGKMTLVSTKVILPQNL